jgi:hypothetical protein
LDVRPKVYETLFSSSAIDSSHVGIEHSALDFHDWLASLGKTKNTITEIFTKRFRSILDTDDASPLLVLSARNKYHAMTALANLEKFTGDIAILYRLDRTLT